MNTNRFTSIGLAAGFLTVLSLVVPVNFEHTLPTAVMPVVWLLLAGLLITSVLNYFVVHSFYSGVALSLVTFIIAFVIGHFNNLIEALIFNVTNSSFTLVLMMRFCLINLIYAPVLVYLSGRWHGPQRLPAGFAGRSVLQWVWRILVSDVLYLFIYFTAGIILQAVYPTFMTYYEGKLPPIGLVIQTQLFLRGFIFIGIAVLISRSLDQPLRYKAVFTGIIFSIIGGIAPLIQPNDLMPAYVRLGHVFEVGISNFLYGFLVGHLVGQGPKKREVANSGR